MLSHLSEITLYREIIYYTECNEELAQSMTIHLNTVFQDPLSVKLAEGELKQQCLFLQSLSFNKKCSLSSIPHFYPKIKPSPFLDAFLSN